MLALRVVLVWAGIPRAHHRLFPLAVPFFSLVMVVSLGAFSSLVHVRKSRCRCTCTLRCVVSVHHTRPESFFIVNPVLLVIFVV